MAVGEPEGYGFVLVFVAVIITLFYFIIRCAEITGKINEEWKKEKPDWKKR
jgi:hypothetical protein